MEVEKILDQTEFESLLNETRTYCDQGLYSEAKKNYTILLNRLKGMPTVPEVKAQVALLEKSVKEVEKALKENVVVPLPLSGKEDVFEIYEKALLFKDLKLYKEAIDRFKELLYKNYKVEANIYNTVYCYKKQGLILDAISFLKELLIDSSFSFEQEEEIRYELARLYEEINAYSKGLACLKEIKNRQRFPGIEERIEYLSVKAEGGSKFDYLVLKGIIEKEDLEKAVSEAEKEKKSVESILMQRHGVRKDEIGKSFSFFFECPFTTFNPNIPVPVDLIRGLKYEYLKSGHWVPLKREERRAGEHGKKEDKIVVVIDNPHDLSRVDVIKHLLNTSSIELVVSTQEDIENIIDYFFDQKEAASIETLVKNAEAEKEEELGEATEEVTETDSHVVKFVDRLIFEAWRSGASDIHIEPSPSNKITTLRFRIDGVCRPYIQVSNSFIRAVISRIKIMANLRIDETRLPQDGKIRIRKKEKDVLELRVATVPTVGGHEDAVLRLLPVGAMLKIDEVGMSEKNLEKCKSIIKLPYGLMLVVGPTGSGKTTTLHSILNHINTPEKKIWTAEDPVEITQPGLRQVEIKPAIGLTFARIMRSFLRANPNVIMIGEMRDRETTSIAIEASLTGHLVFSTLHTNSAPETIARLLSMDIDPLNFADSILGVLAQRLVRTLCKDCKEPYHPGEGEFEELVEEYGVDYFERSKIKNSKDITLYRAAAGCDTCGNTGYRGRIGIHELLVVDDDMRILIRDAATVEKIMEKAVLNGMTTLKQDGIEKVFKGYTDLREVKRVCIK